MSDDMSPDRLDEKTSCPLSEVPAYRSRWRPCQQFATSEPWPSHGNTNTNRAVATRDGEGGAERRLRRDRRPSGSERRSPRREAQPLLPLRPASGTHPTAVEKTVEQGGVVTCARAGADLPIWSAFCSCTCPLAATCGLPASGAPARHARIVSDTVPPAGMPCTILAAFDTLTPVRAAATPRWHDHVRGIRVGESLVPNAASHRPGAHVLAR